MFATFQSRNTRPRVFALSIFSVNNLTEAYFCGQVQSAGRFAAGTGVITRPSSNKRWLSRSAARSSALILRSARAGSGFAPPAPPEEDELDPPGGGGCGSTLSGRILGRLRLGEPGGLLLAIPLEDWAGWLFSAGPTAAGAVAAGPAPSLLLGPPAISTGPGRAPAAPDELLLPPPVEEPTAPPRRPSYRGFMSRISTAAASGSDIQGNGFLGPGSPSVRSVPGSGPAMKLPICSRIDRCAGSSAGAGITSFRSAVPGAPVAPDSCLLFTSFLPSSCTKLPTDWRHNGHRTSSGARPWAADNSRICRLVAHSAHRHK